MKQLIPLILSLAILGLFLIGCESISEPVSDALFPTGEPTGVGKLSGGITKEMCKVDPGWEALGFSNLGQCVRYVMTGKDGRPTVTDIDGNVYQTVTIGNQVWMAENLRTKTYSNGTPIPTGLTDYEWSVTTGGAYGIYPHSQIDGLNTDAEVAAAYGNLYNWYAVDEDRGLCPEGWRIPSDGDWKQLEMYLGMTEQDANSWGYRGSPVGGKLKSTRTEPEAHPRWNGPNIDATNVSGFSGFPGGYRYNYGDFEDIGYYGSWWSSTELNTSSVWSRLLLYVGGDVVRYYNDRHTGFSVRCLRDF